MSLIVDIHKELPGFTLDAAFEALTGVTALLGANGSGKSMTLKCVAGVERPDSGYIALDGRVLFDAKRRVDLPPQRRGVGFLFQRYALFPNMTVAENVEAGLRGSRKQKRARRDELLAAYGLCGLEAHYPHELSGGQQQRVALCRMLAGEPGAILLDEPFSALDLHLRWQTEREMGKVLADFSGTALLVTHDPGEAYRMSSRVCVLDAGRSEPVTDTCTLFSAPRTRAAALLTGCKNFSAIEKRDAHTLLAQDWGGTLLHTAREIPGEARFCGVHARALRVCAEGEENAISATVLSVDEDVDAMICMLATDGGAPLRVETEKAAANLPRPGDRACVSVPPDAIMLLEERREGAIC